MALAGSVQTYTTAGAPAKVITSPIESWTVSATAASGTINYDVLTQSTLLYTSNASANFTLNVRGNSSVSLNSVLPVGGSISVVFLVTNGTTAYWMQNGSTNGQIQIDGTAVTPKWQGGLAPTYGNASSIDAYTLMILKTAANTYSVLASQAKFA